MSVTKKTVQPLNPGQTARRDKVQLEEVNGYYCCFMEYQIGVHLIDGWGIMLRNSSFLRRIKGRVFLA